MCNSHLATFTGVCVVNAHADRSKIREHVHDVAMSSPFSTQARTDDEQTAPPRRIAGHASGGVWEYLSPAGDWIIKCADPTRIACELRALTAYGGRGLAPTVVAAQPGILVTERVAGHTRPADQWTSTDAHALGGVLAAVHAAHALSQLGDPDDPCTHYSAEGYFAHRIAQIQPYAHHLSRELWAYITSVRIVPPEVTMVHGDLWSGNIIWGESGPYLVDWEYAHPGDPAGELAYLVLMDDIRADIRAALLDGYGATEQLRRRVVASAPLIGAWCAAWYFTHADDARGHLMVRRAEERLHEACASGAESG
jgi:hypothetical protein